MWLEGGGLCCCSSSSFLFNVSAWGEGPMEMVGLGVSTPQASLWQLYTPTPLPTPAHQGCVL